MSMICQSRRALVSRVMQRCDAEVSAVRFSVCAARFVRPSPRLACLRPLPRLACLSTLHTRPLASQASSAIKESKAERKAAKKAEKALRLKAELQEEERQALSSGKLLPHDHDQTRLLLEALYANHQQSSGKPLFTLDKSGRSIAKQLWQAPVACVVVDGPESTCLYANLLACVAHRTSSFTELIGSPSGLPSSLPDGKLFESKYSKKVKRGDVELTLHAATRWVAERGGPVAYAFTSMPFS